MSALQDENDELKGRNNLALEIAGHFNASPTANDKIVIDLMVRALTGVDYASWIADYNQGGVPWDAGTNR